MLRSAPIPNFLLIYCLITQTHIHERRLTTLHQYCITFNKRQWDMFKNPKPDGTLPPQLPTLCAHTRTHTITLSLNVISQWAKKKKKKAAECKWELEQSMENDCIMWSVSLALNLKGCWVYLLWNRGFMPADILSLPADKFCSSFAEIDDKKMSKTGEVRNKL